MKRKEYDMFTVDQVANKIINLFTLAKAGRGTGKQSFSRTPRETWVKAANLALSLGADPQHFIDAQFVYRKYNLMPMHLTSQKAAQTYKRYMYMRSEEEVNKEARQDEAWYAEQADNVLKRLVESQESIIKYKFGEVDFDNPELWANIEAMPWSYSPLGLLLVSKMHPKCVERLQDSACLEIANSNDLVTAIRRANIKIEGLDELLKERFNYDASQENKRRNT